MKSSLSMASILCMIACILLTCQVFSSEGRQIRSLSKVRTNYVKSLSHRGIRKLSVQIHKFDHSEISPRKITPQKTSAYLSQTEIHEDNFPSLKPTHDSPRKSHTVKVNKVDSIVQSNCLGVKCSNDFKPTAPGHSPGSGHSFVSNTEKNTPNQLIENSKMQNNLAPSEDDFRHTTAGRSPGAGHAEEDEDPNLTNGEVQKNLPSSPTPMSFFSDSALESTNDMRTTSPGRSPGAGHLITNKIGAKGTRYCLSEKCTDDLRSTKPGDSPGAGHAYVSNSDSITSEQGKHSGIVHLHGAINDYRPTNPGHSPGSGHAFSDKRETNS